MSFLGLLAVTAVMAVAASPLFLAVGAVVYVAVALWGDSWPAFVAIVVAVLFMGNAFVRYVTRPECRLGDLLEGILKRMEEC